MNKTRVAFIINIGIVILVMFSTIWMMFFSTPGVLSSVRLEAFKFFTVDSNILMAVSAAITAFQQGQVIKGKRTDIPIWSESLKLLATCSVALTMIVTVCFLTPFAYSSIGIFGLFKAYNFFMHLFNPLLSIIVFLVFEKSNDLKFFNTFLTLIPFLVYGVYYLLVSIAHMTNGVVEEGYDWYKFFMFGYKSGLVLIPLFTISTYGIGLAIWKLNRIKTKKGNEDEHI